MSTNKIGASLSTLPNDSKYFTETYFRPMNEKQTRNPYSEVKALKFPEKPIRKKNQIHMLSETIQNPEKSSIRNYPQANLTTFFHGSITPRRQHKRAQFQHLSFQSPNPLPTNRSMEDFGATKNRKKVNNLKLMKPDPIIIGEKNLKHNSSLERIWAQPRRHRDNGIKCEQTLQWKTKKKRSYLQLYKEKKSHKV